MIRAYDLLYPKPGETVVIPIKASMVDDWSGLSKGEKSQLRDRINHEYGKWYRVHHKDKIEKSSRAIKLGLWGLGGAILLAAVVRGCGG